MQTKDLIFETIRDTIRQIKHSVIWVVFIGFLWYIITLRPLRELYNWETKDAIDVKSKQLAYIFKALFLTIFWPIAVVLITVSLIIILVYGILRGLIGLIKRIFE